MDNGAHRAPGDICLFPLTTGPVRTPGPQTRKRAIEHFLSFLKQKPDELEVRWLLNLAYMTLGRYPDEVPPAYLIPPAAFASAGRRRALPRRGAARPGSTSSPRPAASSSTISTATAASTS